MAETKYFLYLNDIFNVISIFLFIVILWVLRWLLFVPYIVIKEYYDVGYYHLEGDCRKNDVKKKDLVKSLNRIRKIGNIPPIYPNGWIPLLSSRKLKTGIAKSVSALGETFAIFRGTDGKVHIVDAYCPHLGANLVVGGRIKGDCIECPFHSWKFRGTDGKCVDIPYANKVPEFASVKVWKSMEVNGFVFVWYHAEDEEPSWFPKEIPELVNGDWSFKGGSTHRIFTHMQDITENGTDTNHFSCLHEGNYMIGNDLKNIEGGPFKFVKNIWKCFSQDYGQQEKHILTQKFGQRTEIFGKYTFSSTQLHIQQIGPALSRTTFSLNKEVGVLLHYLIPVAPMEVIVHMEFYSSLIGPFAKYILQTAIINFERDIQIWNSKTYQTSPLLTAEDQSIVKFRKWYSQFYSKNSPRIAPYKNNSIEW